MKIALIEDDQILVRTLKEFLEAEGFQVDYFYSLEEIEDYITLNQYHLIILDLMLGEDDGLEFLRVVREDIKRPIIILTAKDSKADMLKGFDLGADDYVTKPFDSDILLARIKSQLRDKEQEQINYQGTQFNLSLGIVSKNHASIHLTNTEIEILNLLYANQDRPLKADQLATTISQNSQVTGRTVVSHIYNIRKKLMDIDADDPIENIWGRGYLWKKQSNNPSCR